MNSQAKLIEERVTPLVGELGFRLLELKLIPQRRRMVVRIYLDADTDDPDSGVTHGDCALVSREVESFVEGEGLLTGDYVLEVSSPGLDRPLIDERDFRRNRGRILELRGEDSEGRAYTLKGRLVEATKDRLYLEDTENGRSEVELGEIAAAHVVPEFRRSPRRKV
jgi:ribosome maturation factor RimP